VERLGSPPASIIFESGWSGAVLGLTLADERQVVVKVRAFEKRLIACGVAQDALATAGYPCPQLLVPPTAFGPGLLISAETYLPSAPLTEPNPDVMASMLQRLIDLAPPMHIEPPAWAYPDHQTDGRWPRTAGDGDLEEAVLPEWLVDLTDAVRAAALAWDVPQVVGHCDFEAQNLGASGVVYDMDSLGSRPEAFHAGLAAAVWCADAGDICAADLRQSATFLTAYERHRGAPFTAEESQIAWVAGLWVDCYNSAAEIATDRPGQTFATLTAEYKQRALLAGLQGHLYE
jgi:hypothetical protein